MSSDGVYMRMFRNSEHGLPPDKRRSFFRSNGLKLQAPPAVDTPISVPLTVVIPKISDISYGRNDIVAPESNNAIVVRVAVSDETST